MENRICNQHSGLVQAIADVEKDTDKQWTEIDHIRNRPPVWCTAVIAILSGLLGSIITYAAFAVKIAGVVQASN